MNFLVPKLTIIRDRGYLDFLHTEPCIVLGTRGETVDPAHIGVLGKGIKRSDDEVLPLSHCFHSAGHNHGEISMFRERLPDYVLRDALRAYAREMYREYRRATSTPLAGDDAEATADPSDTARPSAPLANTLE